MNKHALKAKQRNIRRLLDYVIRDGEVSRVEIAQTIGVSTATVTNLVSELIEQGYLFESRKKHAPAGRKTTLLCFNDKLAYIVTILMQTESLLELAVCTASGEPLVHQKLEIPLDITPEQPEIVVLKNIIKTVSEFIDAQPPEIKDNIKAAGVCVGGMVNNRDTIDMPRMNWKNVNLVAPLEAKLGIPVYCEGVTRMKALYEFRYLEPYERNVIYLNLSTGIGIVNYFNGHIIQGHTRIAGEAGHISLDIKGPRCYCGNRGCFELYCGMYQVLARSALLIHEKNRYDVLYDLVVNQKAPLTAQTLFEALRRGSLVVHELLSEVAEYLGSGLASLYNIFDPDRIIVSAYLDDDDSFLLENAFVEAKSRIINRFSREMKITRAHLKVEDMHEAIALYVLKQILDEEFLS